MDPVEKKADELLKQLAKLLNLEADNRRRRAKNLVRIRKLRGKQK
jgi:hypothetical protein